MTPTPLPGANAGDAFRYDAVTGTYRYDLDTRSLPDGQWDLVVTLDDGAQATAQIQLRRLAWMPAVLHLLLSP